jgi:transcriptional regulator with XRE-family HTH domain
MASKVRQLDVGTVRAAELVRRSGLEIRQARTDRGLSAAAVGRATRLSTSTVSRIERGLVRRVSVYDLARLHAVVGLELSVRSYPSGQPIRDVAHGLLLAEVRGRLHRSIRWAVEVPLPVSGDLRAWDALIRGEDWAYGVEAETAPRDAQALIRRLQLKQRDGRVDGILLVLRKTVQTRRFVAASGDLLRSAFPVDGARALELLAAGADPRGSAVIVVPAQRTRATFAPRATTSAPRHESRLDTPGLLLPGQIHGQRAG